MIGAVIARRKARSAFEPLNGHNLERLIADWADDCSLCFPGEISVSGEIRGREALKERFARMMEQFPSINFLVKDVYVSDLFAIGGTNRIAIEWQNTMVNRDGNESHNTGITTVKLKNGKVVAMTDYVFNPENLREEWGEV